MPEPVPPSEPQALRISVIVVAYNQADQVRRAIKALSSSNSREHMEILLVDCASKDGTASLDTEFPGINVLRLPHHIGMARALNIATRTAKGDLLFFLSPDVEVLPDTAVGLAEAIDVAPDIVAACPLLMDQSGSPTPRLYRLPDAAAIAGAASGSQLVSVQPNLAEADPVIEYPSLDALMVRKQFVMAMNYFDQRYGHYWVDAEFAMQAKRAGKKIRLCPNVHVIYHPAPDPLAGDPGAAADRILGAAEFAGKYGGSSVGLRLKSMLGALARFDFSLFSRLLSGQKLDGSQAG